MVDSHLTLPISLGAIAVLLLGWAAKILGEMIVGWFKKVNKHMADCTAKEVTEALLAQQVKTMDNRMTVVEQKVDTVAQAVNENHVEIMNQLLAMSNGAHK